MSNLSVKKIGGFFLALTILFFSLFSYASEGTFPAKEIFFQIFNFSIFVMILFFLMRKPIKVFFHKRQEEFFAFEKQAFQLEKEKQEELKTWEKKIQVLRDQEKEIEKKAQAEGEKFVFQQKEEIRTLKIRFKRESDFFLRLEREKSKRELLEKWKDKVISETSKNLDKQARFLEFQREQFRDFFTQMEIHL